MSVAITTPESMTAEKDRLTSGSFSPFVPLKHVKTFAPDLEPDSPLSSGELSSRSAVPVDPNFREFQSARIRDATISRSQRMAEAARTPLRSNQSTAPRNTPIRPFTPTVRHRRDPKPVRSRAAYHTPSAAPIVNAATAAAAAVAAAVETPSREQQLMNELKRLNALEIELRDIHSAVTANATPLAAGAGSGGVRFAEFRALRERERERERENGILSADPNHAGSNSSVTERPLSAAAFNAEHSARGGGGEFDAESGEPQRPAPYTESLVSPRQRRVKSAASNVRPQSAAAASSGSGSVRRVIPPGSATTTRRRHAIDPASTARVNRDRIERRAYEHERAMTEFGWTVRKLETPPPPAAALPISVLHARAGWEDVKSDTAAAAAAADSVPINAHLFRAGTSAVLPVHHSDLMLRSVLPAYSPVPTHHRPSVDVPRAATPISVRELSFAERQNQLIAWINRLSVLDVHAILIAEPPNGLQRRRSRAARGGASASDDQSDGDAHSQSGQPHAPAADLPPPRTILDFVDRHNNNLLMIAIRAEATGVAPSPATSAGSTSGHASVSVAAAAGVNDYLRTIRDRSHACASIVRLLCEFGVDINHRNTRGQCVMQLAIGLERPNPAVIQTLLWFGSECTKSQALAVFKPSNPTVTATDVVAWFRTPEVLPHSPDSSRSPSLASSTTVSTRQLGTYSADAQSYSAARKAAARLRRADKLPAALWVAARTGDMETVTHLLVQNPELVHTMCHGVSLFYVAACFGDLPLWTLLMRVEADILSTASYVKPASDGAESEVVVKTDSKSGSDSPTAGGGAAYSERDAVLFRSRHCYFENRCTLTLPPLLAAPFRTDSEADSSVVEFDSAAWENRSWHQPAAKAAAPPTEAGAPTDSGAETCLDAAIRHRQFVFAAHVSEQNLLSDRPAHVQPLLSAAALARLSHLQLATSGEARPLLDAPPSAGVDGISRFLRTVRIPGDESTHDDDADASAAATASTATQSDVKTKPEAGATSSAGSALEIVSINDELAAARIVYEREKRAADRIQRQIIVNGMDCISVPDCGDARNLLHYACMAGRIDIIRLLLKHGGSADGSSSAGGGENEPASASPLRVLLSECDVFGCTPIDLAFFYGHLSIGHWLFEHRLEATPEPAVASPVMPIDFLLFLSYHPTRALPARDAGRHTQTVLFDRPLPVAWRTASGFAAHIQFVRQLIRSYQQQKPHAVALTAASGADASNADDTGSAVLALYEKRLKLMKSAERNRSKQQQRKEAADAAAAAQAAEAAAREVAEAARRLKEEVAASKAAAAAAAASASRNAAAHTAAVVAAAVGGLSSPLFGQTATPAPEAGAGSRVSARTPVPALTAVPIESLPVTSLSSHRPPRHPVAGHSAIAQAAAQALFDGLPSQQQHRFDLSSRSGMGLSGDDSGDMSFPTGSRMMFATRTDPAAGANASGLPVRPRSAGGVRGRTLGDSAISGSALDAERAAAAADRVRPASASALRDSGPRASALSALWDAVSGATKPAPAAPPRVVLPDPLHSSQRVQSADSSKWPEPATPRPLPFDDPLRAAAAAELDRRLAAVDTYHAEQQARLARIEAADEAARQSALAERELALAEAERARAAADAKAAAKKDESRERDRQKLRSKFTPKVTSVFAALGGIANPFATPTASTAPARRYKRTSILPAEYQWRLIWILDEVDIGVQHSNQTDPSDSPTAKATPTTVANSTTTTAATAVSTPASSEVLRPPGSGGILPLAELIRENPYIGSIAVSETEVITVDSWLLAWEKLAKGAGLPQIDHFLIRAHAKIEKVKEQRRLAEALLSPKRPASAKSGRKFKHKLKRRPASARKAHPPIESLT